MLASVASHPQYCDVGSWNTSWLGPEDGVAAEKQIEISGEDLAMYRGNTDPVAEKLDRMNVAAAKSGDGAALKAYLLDLARKEAFTRLKPYHPTRWEGTKPSWIGWYSRTIPEAEPAFRGAILMTSASISFALAKPAMTPDEIKTILAWGRKLYSTVNGAKKTQMANRAARDSAPDIRGAYAAAFTAWGGTVGDPDIFRRGVSLFEEGIRHLRPDGSDRFFVAGQWGGVGKGIELKYLNFAYGGLSTAAYVAHINGIDAYNYRPAGDGSLVDGLKFLLEASLDPSKRKRMTKSQDTKYLWQSRSAGDQSLAYLEYVSATGALDAKFDKMAIALSVRDYSYPKGFYGAFDGGYTSCLFSQ
jgi:hypothetical protein